jgi:glutamate formiminotransferase
MTCIECVPNVSEGRRPDVIERGARAITGAGAALLDVSSDPAHNRTVYTFAQTVDIVARAVHALFDAALASIDLRMHHGEHPRMGAVDVVPFVPLSGVPMSTCVRVAREVAAAVAERHALPVYLYEEATLRPERRRLEQIRRGGFEALAARMQEDAWAPDFGPRHPHPTAGASVIGARRFLIAYNVTLATTRLDVARRIAASIRESSGGLPALKAMGVALEDRGVVQVSMNLTDFTRTSMTDAFDAVVREAAASGVDVLESELVGLAPADALSKTTAEHIRLTGYTDAMILERRLGAAGLGLGSRL